MYSKITDAFETKEELDAHVARWGGFNDFPPEWEEITALEYGRMMAHETPIGVEYRQMWDGDRNSRRVFAHLYFFHDETGVAVQQERVYPRHGENFKPHDEVHFFRFGCAHDWRPVGYVEAKARFDITLYSCEHLSECTKCGQLWQTDSSD